MDKIKKPLPMPLRYAINLAVFAVFLFGVNALITGGSVPNYYTKVIVLCGINIILAVSLNVATGYLGQLPLGHAGFMAVGAYASALFLRAVPNLPEFVAFPLGIILGGVVSGIFGILIGIPVLRLNGDYLAIVTLAFGEIIKNVFAALYVGIDSKGLHIALNQADMNLEADGTEIIRGALGVKGVPNDSSFVVGFILLLITLIISYNYINSRTGRAVKAIRDNSIAAESVGPNITKYKLITFALTAFLAGIAGALYSHNYATLQASKFDYNLSILILVFVVLGGIGNIRGSVIAAVVLTLIPELLRSINSYRMLIYSIVLIVMMILTSNEKARTFIVTNFGKLKGMVLKIFKRKDTAEKEVK